MLTVEIRDGYDSSLAEVAICFDEEGLEFLMSKLASLRGIKDHEHLMTPSWAGDDLSEIKQGSPEYELINHLRLVKL